MPNSVQTEKNLTPALLPHQIFIQGLDKARNVYNEAMTLLTNSNTKATPLTKSLDEPDQSMAIDKLKESISINIDSFALYLAKISAENIFLPQIEWTRIY